MRGLPAGATTLTVLFTDLVSSTELRTRLGDERADRLRREHDDLVQGAVERNGGVVVKGLGDGMMAAFPAPSGAVAAAVAIQRTIEQRNVSAPVPLALRVGVSAGEVRVEADDVFGTAVVEASRLCAAAEAHQILMADVVRVLAGSRSTVSCRPVGNLTLKGLGQGLASVEVAWWETAGSAPGVGFPDVATLDRWLPLVGRRLEQVAASQAVMGAMGGRARLLVLRGPAGAGKTRLAGEVARRADRDGVTVLYGRADGLPSPHRPLAEAFGGLVESMGPDRATAGLEPRHAALTRFFPNLAGLVAEGGDEPLPLGHALGEWLRGLAADTGVIVVLDDLHQADPETISLIEQLVVHPGDARVLVVAAAQVDPGADDPLGGLAAAVRAAGHVVEQLDLGPLDVAAVDDALGRLGLDAGADRSALAVHVHAASGGYPLYVAEVLHVLRLDGWLVEDTSVDAPTRRAADAAGGRSLTLPRPVPAEAVPVGLSALERRLGQLDPAARAVLRTASAAGLTLDVDLLAGATDADTGALVAVLERTDAARLTVRSGGSRRRRSFAHDAHRYLLERDTHTDTVGVHARLAEVLEERRALGDRQVVHAIARHRLAAGLLDASTLAALLEAADDAEGRLAPAVAGVWFGEAAEVAQALVDRGLPLPESVPDVAELRRRAAHVFPRDGDPAMAATT